MLKCGSYVVKDGDNAGQTVAQSPIQCNNPEDWDIVKASYNSAYPGMRYAIYFSEDSQKESCSE